MPYAKKEQARLWARKYWKRRRKLGLINRSHRERDARNHKKYSLKIKLKVIKYYCGDTPHCQCPGCHTVDVCFLQADHKNGDGHLCKEKGRKLSSTELWLWVIKNNYPSTFQVLCANCNFAKRRNKVCPRAGAKH